MQRVRRTSASTENLILGVALVTILTIVTGLQVGEPFAIGVFAVCSLGGLVLKALLGESLRLTRLSIPSFFMTAYFGVMALPALWVYSVMTNDIRYQYLMAVEGVLIIYPLGVFLANLTEDAPNTTIARYFETPIEQHPADRRLIGAYQIMLMLSVPIFVLYAMTTPRIQLWEVMRGYPSGNDPLAFRFATEGMPKVAHFLFEMMRRVMLPIALLYAFLMYRAYGGKWKYHFWILFPVSFFISAITLDRSPPIALLLTVAMGYLLANRRSIFGLMRPRTLILAAVAMLAGGVISIFQYQRAFDIILAFKIMWYVASYRLGQDAAAQCYRAFEAFNAQNGFLNGANVRALSWLPGHRYIESLGNGTDFISASPVSFVGDLWRNWGWTAVIIGTLAIGFAHQLIQIKLLRRKTVAAIAVHAFLLLGSILIIHGNAMGIVTTSIMAVAAVGASYVKRTIERIDRRLWFRTLFASGQREHNPAVPS